MLRLTQGATSNIVVTLQEKTTLQDPYYLFVFQHVTTNEKVKFIKAPADDLSNYPERYNEYTIDVATLFTGAVGQYQYRVYEQASDSNTDETGLTEVENGKAVLLDATPTEYKQYEPDTTYKAYAG